MPLSVSVSGLLKAAVLAPGLALLLGLGGPAASAQSGRDAPPDSPFARDFSLLLPPVPAPLEVFGDLEGRPLRLADFAGGVVLVNFWATWCAPCIREMPALDRLQSILAGEGLTVLAVSIDRGGAKLVAPFAEKLGLKHLEIALDPKSALARAFGIAGLPSSFLIDRDAQVVRGLAGPAEWDSDQAVALIRYYLKQGGAGSVQKAGAGEGPSQ